MTERDSSSKPGPPLRILIVGAGIGGLTAALAFRRQGHHVTVFEKSKFASEIGAAIYAAPNCSRILRQLGVETADLGRTTMGSVTQFEASGEHIATYPVCDPDQPKDKMGFLVHRAHLHGALKNAALSDDGGGGGPGRPVELHLSSQVVELHPSAGRLALRDGREFEGDLIIGADGVHSWTRQFIDPAAKAAPCGVTLFRWLGPNDDDDEAGDAGQQGDRYYASTVSEWSSEGGRRIIHYPFGSGEKSNVAAFVPSSEAGGDAVDHQSPEAQKQMLLDLFRDFGPRPLDCIRQAPEDAIKPWPLMDMAPLGRWVDGRLALVGDAGHPFTPFMGQGAAMAIEDGATLAALLPPGTTPGAVEGRLALWQHLRKGRVDRIQAFSRRRGLGSHEQKPSREEVKQESAYCSEYNALDAAADVLTGTTAAHFLG